MFSILLTSQVAAADLRLEGQWQLNYEETDKVTVKYEDGSGVGKPNILNNVSVSVMGLPLPSTSRIPSKSGLPPKDPEVLLCSTMRIRTDGDKLKLLYDQGTRETLIRGDYRGRKTTWSKEKIRQNYKTPDRKVTKTWSMRRDGRLLVSVKFNPRGDRARTYNRVFDRIEVVEAPAPTEEAAQEQLRQQSPSQ